MARGGRGRRRIASRQFRSTPYPLPCNGNISGDLYPNKCVNSLVKKDWEDATCSVCMEFPHNAVLLLCSSHDKGCRPYMCGTSLRYSNCLDQYKKAYTKVTLSNHTQPPPHGLVNSPPPIGGPDSSWLDENCEITELACPLCRGQVKGWTVVEPAREYLNEKMRSCMQDGCSFVGTYKELRKHVRAEHPSARPREVDPALEQKWRRLEREREHDDVISTIRSTTPGAVVFGDYVIEGNNYGLDSDEEDGGGVNPDGGERNTGFDRNFLNVFLLLQAFGPGSNDSSHQIRQPERFFSLRSDESGFGMIRNTTPLSSIDSYGRDNYNSVSDDDDDDDGGGGGVLLASRISRQGRVLLGRSGRRRRRRELNDGGR